LALLLSTSGSTGEPRLVKLSLSNLHANAASIAECLALTPEERPITTLPIHYSYGLSVINSHLLVGATVLLTDKSVASAPFWPFFKAHEASSLSGVPTTYAILRKLRFERMSLPSLRTMTQAGGAMPPEDQRWFSEQALLKGQKLVVMYEATARMTCLPSERLIEKLGSIGLAIPGGQLLVVDEQGTPVSEAGQVGELLYKGPNVMMGYATEAADLALPDQQGGTLRTGDLGWQDEEGFAFITGRLKRFIKVFGQRIGLDEVESSLQQSGFDVAVTGRDDLLVVAVRNVATDNAALCSLVAHRYRLHPSAIRVALVDTFPLSSSGKLQYAELLRLTTL
jgi:long-chain acyl-CoA synthetase